jgi:DNA-binding beta-propeller fold protein YncE
MMRGSLFICKNPIVEKCRPASAFFCPLLIFLMGILMTRNLEAEDAGPLRLIQTIPLRNVEGRIDHMAVDIKGQRLFIATLGNNAVEVLDLRAGKRVRSITGLHEPQGVAFISELNRIFVANGQTGVVDIIDGASSQPIKSVKLGADADNIRYDANAHRLYVGYGSGGLGILDPISGTKIGDIKLDGHPESFQLEKFGPRIFVNLPASAKIAVVNREERTTLAAWPTTSATANFSMALDETHHRLFVCFRKPAKLFVYDTESGKEVAVLDSPGDADDIFYDDARKRIYISGGEGVIAVVQQQDADHYKNIAKIATASGARTSFWVPEMSRLYLAVPHRGTQGAEMRVYESQP